MATMTVDSTNGRRQRDPKTGEITTGGGTARLSGLDSEGRKVKATVTFEAKDASKYYQGATIVL